MGSQAPTFGLIDQVVINLVPVVFGAGRPFFATGRDGRTAGMEHPTTIVRGDRGYPRGLRREPQRLAAVSVAA